MALPPSSTARNFSMLEHAERRELVYGYGAGGSRTHNAAKQAGLTNQSRVPIPQPLLRFTNC